MSGRNRKNQQLRKITVTAIMSALGFVLMLFGDAVKLPFMPSFIKLDLAELPALITSFAFGPAWGVAVCLVKNLLHLMTSFGNSFGIGELSNFLLGASFVAVAGIVYKKNHNRKFALIGALAGDVAMGVACVVANNFITYPLYEHFIVPKEAILGMYQVIAPSVDSYIKGILMFNVPFTMFKGLLSVAITFIIYHKLSPILKGNKLTSD